MKINEKYDINEGYDYIYYIDNKYSNHSIFNIFYNDYKNNEIIFCIENCITDEYYETSDVKDFFKNDK